MSVGGSEGLLHGPQLLVAEHGFERVEIGVGAQHENAVEPFLVLDLVRVDREVLIADRLQVAAIAGVADERLVAPLERPLQRGEDRGAIGEPGLLARLQPPHADQAAERIRLFLDRLVARQLDFALGRHEVSSFRGELSFEPRDLELTPIAVADLNGKPIGVAQVKVVDGEADLRRAQRASQRDR